MSIVQNVCRFAPFCNVCDVDNVPIFLGLHTTQRWCAQPNKWMWWFARDDENLPAHNFHFYRIKFRLSFDLFFRETFCCCVASGCCHWCKLPESSHSAIVQFRRCHSADSQAQSIIIHGMSTVFEIDLMSECRMPCKTLERWTTKGVSRAHNTIMARIYVHFCSQTNARARATNMYINDIEIVSIYSVICPKQNDSVLDWVSTFREWKAILAVIVVVQDTTLHIRQTHITCNYFVWRTENVIHDGSIHCY